MKLPVRISNIKEEALKKIIDGLKEECLNKTYIDNSEIIDNKINTFLSKVHFVIDDKEKSEYVKK